MAAPNAKDITKVGHDVLSTTQSQKTGLITAQTGDNATGDVSANDSEWYFPPGIVGRPRKAEPGKKAAQVVAITRSDNDAIVGCRDDRINDIVGQLDEGETAVFASAEGGAVAYFRNDGSIQLYNGHGEVQLKPDGTVLIGDGTAVAVAKASGIADLQQAILGWTPVSNDGGAALKAALVNWLAAQYGTTKGKIT